MSIHSIHQYQNEVEKIIHYGGTKKETAIRNAFYNLLNEYAKQRGLMLVTEVTIKAPSGKNVTPDGTLKDMLRQDWGYWESKDESDVIDEEIKKKFDKGYPKENILFEDSQTAVLIQNGIEKQRVTIKDAEALHQLLTAFVTFERPEVTHFRKAIEHFKQDIPKVTEAIRGLIIEQEASNLKYNKAAEAFLKLCHDSINPEIKMEDVREMIIQHILTEDIFNTIFDETQFHRENNVARELETVIHTFFIGQTRRIALGSIQHYYQAINAAAAGIADHHEKQKFLKVVYETFYKSYNPKAADRLGVVYTPNEVVRFMIESGDYLLHKHFNKFLEDRDVEILDPATGTGTFVCDLIDYLRKEKLEYKYRNEIHANEVAILPYYISNLNIEFTYTQRTGKYVEFKNLCFVDTLDNISGLHEKVSGIHSKYKVQGDLFALSSENSQRIIDQNRKKISVIIGNPPYNAKQENYNTQNANRQYKAIDQRIKDTFIKYGTAQNQIMVYDMYTRFYRWAFDRLDDNGIIAFVTNRSFIDSRTLDGFRKTIQQDFDYAYIIDTKSDVRTNPKIAGTTHNIFGIQTGVAIMFLVKRKKKDNAGCKIHYVALDDFWKKEQKLEWLSQNPLKQIPFEIVRPDKNNNWIDLTENDWDELLPLMDKNVKSGKSKKALFELFSRGVETGRDEWNYSLNKKDLFSKITFLVDKYNFSVGMGIQDFSIKWNSSLEDSFKQGIKANFSEQFLIQTIYRPFNKLFQYSDKIFNHRLTQNHYDIKGQGLNRQNLIIFLPGLASPKEFHLLSSDCFIDMNGMPAGSQCLPLYRYDVNGKQIENITDWGYNQFAKQYGKKAITKEAIFYYVYAVLHNPAYRKKYSLNLKREFPRIPFFTDFGQWANWGKQLMDLHINYESVQPYKLQTVTTDSKEAPKVKLKADKEKGTIILDENTILTGVPADAWAYKLGNRSALEWILDQYKESKPKDPTIAERFNTYHFAEYKEQVIELLKRVCTVSVETMEIIEQMQQQNS
ncbi:MAG: type ISP restriction/modification enzyme [Flavisolibacter sp.]